MGHGALAWCGYRHAHVAREALRRVSDVSTPLGWGSAAASAAACCRAPLHVNTGRSAAERRPSPPPPTRACQCAPTGHADRLRGPSLVPVSWPALASPRMPRLRAPRRRRAGPGAAGKEAEPHTWVHSACGPLPRARMHTDRSEPRSALGAPLNTQPGRKWGGGAPLWVMAAKSLITKDRATARPAALPPQQRATLPAAGPVRRDTSHTEGIPTCGVGCCLPRAGFPRAGRWNLAWRTSRSGVVRHRHALTVA